jgi:hypothetical protein
MGHASKLDWYMVATYGYFTCVHAFHVGVRHATTPYSEYNRYYTEIISTEEIDDQLTLAGGINTTPKRVNRELNRTFVKTGVNRCLVKKIHVYDCAWDEYMENLRNRNFYDGKEWDINQER